MMWKTGMPPYAGMVVVCWLSLLLTGCGKDYETQDLITACDLATHEDWEQRLCETHIFDGGALAKASIPIDQAVKELQQKWWDHVRILPISRRLRDSDQARLAVMTRDEKRCPTVSMHAVMERVGTQQMDLACKKKYSKACRREKKLWMESQHYMEDKLKVICTAVQNTYTAARRYAELNGFEVGHH